MLSSTYKSEHLRCEVKSKYFGRWQPRLLAGQLQNGCYILTRQDNLQTKTIMFTSITHCQLKHSNDINHKVLVLQNNLRSYEIKHDQQKQLDKFVKLYWLWRNYKQFIDLPEKHIQRPIIVDYTAYEHDSPVKKQLTMTNIRLQHQYTYIQQYQPYFKPLDWRIDPQEGGLLFINQDKKSLQPRIITFLIQKFLSTGSFMGLSFPVFAMKPQSILETYCRCLTLAVPLFKHCPRDPVQRIKLFNCLILTLSIRFTDIDKSFNPVLGETFQAKIGHQHIYAQQISHHPPISAFLFKSKHYTISGSLQVRASMGFNKARGYFIGEVCIHWKDGGIIRGKLPSGVLRGYLFGKYIFHPDGANYSYDPVNQIVCSYELVDKDVLRGCIGRLREREYPRFVMIVKHDAGSCKEKYEEFEHVPQSAFEKVYSRMEANWTRSVSYDGIMYMDFQKDQWKALRLNKNNDLSILPSDSRYRKDIALRQSQNMEQAQQAKQQLQEEQRRLQRLRNDYKQSRR